MKRILGVLAVAGLALAGCDKGDNNNIKLDGGVDMRMSTGGDMTVVAKAAVGEPCTANNQCQGNICITDAQGFPDGYCSKACTMNSQCDTDAGESCIGIGNNQGRCVSGCDAVDSCRDGYQCYIGWNCLPTLEAGNGITLCDPTANNTCPAGQACQRAIHNDGSAGMTGTCVDTCVLGVGTCGADDQCVVYSNASQFKVDAQALTDVYTNDKGVYAVCAGFVFPAADVNANGEDCDAESTTGEINKFSYSCNEGSQCSRTAAERAYFDDNGPSAASGDNKCHTLCYQPGQAPAGSPDGGGTVAATCPTGTCTDVWGLFNNTAGNIKAGLCL